MKQFLNLACGDAYIVSADWTNIDFYQDSPSIVRADLLKKLPIPEASFDLVYSSHFLEHIPRSQTLAFLEECHRVLRPGGTIRLVLPDLESIVLAYLENRRLGLHDKADFAVLELIDQCVRTRRGGEMGVLFQKLSKSMDAESTELRDFILERVGQELDSPPAKKTLPLLWSWNRSISALQHLIRSGTSFARKSLIRAWLSPLPSAFKSQNLSFADTGEKHHWVWDFYQLSEALRLAGFSQIVRQSAGTSTVTDFPFFPLDLDRGGWARMGLGSMYVEATKSGS